MVSNIKSNARDLLVVANRLDNTACLEGIVDIDAWRKVMHDLAGQAYHNIGTIYNELAATEAEELEREDIMSAEAACGDTDKECFEV